MSIKGYISVIIVSFFLVFIVCIFCFVVFIIWRGFGCRRAGWFSLSFRGGFVLVIVFFGEVSLDGVFRVYIFVYRRGAGSFCVVSFIGSFVVVICVGVCGFCLCLGS